MKVGLRCAQNSVVKKKIATTLIKKKVKFDEFTFALLAKPTNCQQKKRILKEKFKNSNSIILFMRCP